MSDDKKDMEKAKTKTDKMAAKIKSKNERMGKTLWDIPAGQHAIKLLGNQPSITVEDIIESLKSETKYPDEMDIIDKEAIIKLRDLQRHQQQK